MTSEQEKRLEKIRAGVGVCYSREGIVTFLLAMVDALRAELAAWKGNSDGWQKWCEGVEKTRDALRAENERLRRALETFYREDECPACGHQARLGNPVEHTSDCFLVAALSAQAPAPETAQLQSPVISCAEAPAETPKESEDERFRRLVALRAEALATGRIPISTKRAEPEKERTYRRSDIEWAVENSTVELPGHRGCLTEDTFWRLLERRALGAAEPRKERTFTQAELQAAWDSVSGPNSLDDAWCKFWRALGIEEGS